ncbi:MAG: hypothetical protein DYH08_02045 [Actinobacteria bacterium ATB1]|nr:hypothetical protein [Actinobacteria bacterium ATB1]
MQHRDEFRSIDEQAWFLQHHEEALGTVRRLWKTVGQLDGGLTAGQSTDDRVLVAFALKYEAQGGLVAELGDLQDCLGEDWLEASPRLRSLDAKLASLKDFVEEHLWEIVHARYAEPEFAVDALMRFRATAEELQSIIDDCTAGLVHRLTVTDTGAG